MENNKEKITVESVIKADIKTVWDFWTSSEHIKKWCHASDDWGVGDVFNDLKKGGRFSTNMHALDGTLSFDFTGEYMEVDQGKSLKYKMDKLQEEDVNRECEVIFESIDMEDGLKSTKVTEIFDPENLNSRELQIAGWQAILNNFKKLVENEL